MSDYIILPCSMLTQDLWRDQNLSRLLLYLLSIADDEGMVTFNTTMLGKEFGWSRQQSRQLINRLKATTKATAFATANTTTLRFDIQPNKPKRQPLKQPHLQPQKQPLNETNTQKTKDGFERFREWFNTSVEGSDIPKIMKLTEARINTLRKIFKEYDRETVECVIGKVIASDFLSKEWGKVSFDWIFKKANFIKILEGNYDNRTRQSQMADKFAARRGTDVGTHTEADYGVTF